MRVLVIGKKQQMRWPENVAKFLPIEHERQLFLYNQKTFGSLLYKFFGKHRWAYQAALFKKKIETFKPDLIFFVSAFFVPIELYRVAATFNHVLKIGWVGDNFDEKMKEKADLLDVLFCSDTGYLNKTKKFACRSFYLPLCADEKVFKNEHKKHTKPPFFAGDSNPVREKYLSAIHTPVDIYGSHWQKNQLAGHHVHNKRLSHAQLSSCYNASLAPINMTFSKNIINGLNFRIFEIGSSGGLIIVNEGKDLRACYEIDKECVTYKTPEELDVLVADIVKNPLKYNQIAQAGYLRTLKDHTYQKRLVQLFSVLDSLK